MDQTLVDSSKMLFTGFKAEVVSTAAAVARVLFQQWFEIASRMAERLQPSSICQKQQHQTEPFSQKLSHYYVSVLSHISVNINQSES